MVRRLTGVVKWPKKVTLEFVTVRINRKKAPTDPDEIPDWRVYDLQRAGKYDGQDKLVGTHAEFVTERILPGRYVVGVRGYKPRPTDRASRRSMQWPSFAATKEIDIPQAGDVPRMDMQLKPYNWSDGPPFF